MKISTIKNLLLLGFILFSSAVSEAKLVQILHTNDTHSFLDNSTHSKNRGGSARLKALIDHYKSKMQSEGVSTLVVDAGDFLEGNSYFMAADGRKTFAIHNEVGYDVGTLGNHDYQMGGAELNKILGEIDLKFSMIVANLDIENKFENIKEKIKPYREFEIDGIKIAFLGLTTDEILYKWRLKRGAILDPYDTAKKYELILKDRKNDFIFALTHIGVLKDIKLAEKTHYIDLIVGGHSHTALYEPAYGVNKLKRRIPIVQAGMHTEYLGRIVVDLVKGKPLKIVSYELVPVTYEASNLVDEGIKQLVEQADEDLNASYGKDYLNEKIGFSDLKAGDLEAGMRRWAFFIADAMKEKTGADIAIHSPPMNGENYPVGEISRRTIMNSMPRIFEVNQKYGWDIYTTKIKGAWLRMTINGLSYFGEPLTFSGLKMEYERGPFGFKIRKVTINGKKINPFRTYTVAFSEGIIKGARAVDPRTIAIMRNPFNTGHKIWATLEEKIKVTDSISRVTNEDHTTIEPKN